MVSFEELDRAYQDAKFGTQEPSLAIMSTDAITRLYRMSWPMTPLTNEQIINRLRQSKFAVCLDDGIWIISKDEITGGVGVTAIR